jgi:hypothetical protein
MGGCGKLENENKKQTPAGFPQGFVFFKEKIRNQKKEARSHPLRHQQFDSSDVSLRSHSTKQPEKQVQT